MNTERRAAVAAYKGRKSVAGVFALRCLATGEAWVGGAPDIDTIFNRLRFSLNGGRHTRPNLQAAWTRAGEPGFSFEVLQRLPEAPTAYARDADLKDCIAAWRVRLGASPA